METPNPYAPPETVGRGSAAPPGRGHRYGTLGDPSDFTPGGKLATAAIIALWVSLAIDGLSILAGLLEYSILSGLNEGAPVSQSMGELWGVLTIVTAGAKLLVVLPVAVLFALWVHRMYRNLPALDQGITRMSPTMAAALFFIPIANLIAPPIVCAEIWRKSSPELYLGSQLAQKHSQDVTIVVWWWGLLLGKFAVGFAAIWITLQGYATNSVPTLWMGTFVGIAGNIFGVAAATSARNLIDKLGKRQQARLRALQAKATPQP